jgi:hypothetical protein
LQATTGAGAEEIEACQLNGQQVILLPGEYACKSPVLLYQLGSQVRHATASWNSAGRRSSIFTGGPLQPRRTRGMSWIGQGHRDTSWCSTTEMAVRLPAAANGAGLETVASVSQVVLLDVQPLNVQSSIV